MTTKKEKLRDVPSANLWHVPILNGGVSPIERRQKMATKKGCVTEERKIELIGRLSRIEGQIKGLKAMVSNKRYCLEILQQISSVHEALRGTGKVLMKNYLEVCATGALQSKSKDKQEKIYNEMMDIIYKFAK